jgi:hypothetical protein
VQDGKALGPHISRDVFWQRVDVWRKLDLTGCLKRVSIQPRDGQHSELGLILRSLNV